MKRILTVLLFLLLLSGCQTPKEIDIEMSVYLIGRFNQTEIAMDGDTYEPHTYTDVPPRFNFQYDAFQITSPDEFDQYSNLSKEEFQNLYPDEFFENHSLIVIPYVTNHKPIIELQDFNIEKMNLSLKFTATDQFHRFLGYEGQQQYLVVLEITSKELYNLDYSFQTDKQYTHYFFIKNMGSEDTSYVVYEDYQTYIDANPNTTIQAITEETFEDNILLLYTSTIGYGGEYHEVSDIYVTHNRLGDTIVNTLQIEFNSKNVSEPAPMAVFTSQDFLLLPRDTLDGVTSIFVSMYDSNYYTETQYDYPLDME